MNHSEFTAFVKDTLGDRVREQGATLYSAFDTLKKGKLYILGLNPGGGDSITIEQSLDQILDPSYNQYLMQWDRAEGEHPLQKNIQVIAQQFSLKVQEVCASNLIFTRSVGQDGANYSLRNDYWPIHRRILKIVQPKVIVAFGNGPISPYQHLLDISQNKAETDSVESGHGEFACVSFKAEIDNQLMTVIGLPHLSRYHLYTDNPAKKKVLEWIKGKAEG